MIRFSLSEVSIQPRYWSLMRTPTYLQAPLSVVDDNRKVVGALSVVGATIVKIVSKFQYYFLIFWKENQNFRKSAGIPWNSGEIPWNFHRKITQFHQISAKFWENPERSLKICKIVQKSVNFELWCKSVFIQLHCADLEKCCKMSIYLQNSASIQLRTSHKKVKNSSRKTTDGGAWAPTRLRQTWAMPFVRFR